MADHNGAGADLSDELNRLIDELAHVRDEEHSESITRARRRSEAQARLDALVAGWHPKSPEEHKAAQRVRVERDAQYSDAIRSLRAAVVLARTYISPEIATKLDDAYRTASLEHTHYMR